MFKSVIIIGSFLLFFVGCSTPTKIGPNTYLLESSRSTIYSDISNFCKDKDLSLKIIRERTTNRFGTRTVIDFKCLDSNSLEYKKMKIIK